MAISAILSGSTLGFFSSLMGWLFLGLTGWQALTLYLVLGLVIPLAGIALKMIFMPSPRATQPLPQNAPQSAAQTA